MTGLSILNSTPKIIGKSNSALHAAIEEGHYKSIDYLLRMKVDPNVRNHKGYTPLMHCCQLPPTPALMSLVKVLLKYGADPMAVDLFTGANLLGQAIQQNNIPMVKLLNATNDLDFHHRDKMGSTVLHYLAEASELMATIVLKTAARFHIHVDIVNAEDMTPLMLSCYIGNIKVARLLAQYGASLTARDNRWHLNALDWYKLHGKHKARKNPSISIDNQRNWPDDNPLFDQCLWTDPRCSSPELPCYQDDNIERLDDNTCFQETFSWMPQRHSLSSSFSGTSAKLRSMTIKSNHERKGSSKRTSSVPPFLNKNLPDITSSKFNPPEHLILAGEKPLLRRVFTLYEMHLSRSFCEPATPIIHNTINPAYLSDVLNDDDPGQSSRKESETHPSGVQPPPLRRKLSSIAQSFIDSSGANSLRQSSPSRSLQRKTSRLQTNESKTSSGSVASPDFFREASATSRLTKSRKNSVVKP